MNNSYTTINPSEAFNPVSSIPLARFAFAPIAIALALLQVVGNRHTIGTDGVSYLDMADAVVQGDWSQIVNGHWSPLYPLLLAAGLKLIQPSPWNENAMVQAINFIIFLGALAAFEFFARQLFRARPDWALRICGYALFIWSTIPIVTIKLTTPDLLLAALVYLAGGILLRTWERTRLACASSLGIVPRTWERTRLACASSLGIVLGIGYWAKSPMFLFAFVFIALIPLALGNLRGSLPHMATAFIAFAALALPLVALQSKAQGKLTFSEVGKHSYAWYVNHIQEFHWRGQPPGYGEALHPTRQIFSSPPAYEFASPIGGTYPLWFDPSYWAAGVRPRFDLNQQIEAIRVNLPVYADLFLDLPALLLLAGIAARIRNGAETDWTTSILLFAPAIACFGMYLLVHVEARFIAPFTVLATLGCLSAVRFNRAFDFRLLVALAIAGCALSIARPTARDLLTLIRGKSYPERQVAAGLQALGLQPGDRVAVTAAASSHGKWARPARLRITAEIDTTNPLIFWSLDDEGQRQLLDRFSRTGVRALISEAPPREAIPPSWQRVGETGYHAYLFAR